MTAGVCEVKIENGTLFSDDSSCGGSVEVIGDGHKGFRNDGRIVECSELGINLIAFAKNDEVNGVNEEVIVKIESIVNPPVINGGSQDSLNGEIGQVNGLQNMVVETVEPDSSLQPSEDSKSQGTISQSLSTCNSNVIKTVEDLGVTHDPVENKDTKLMVADSLDYTGNPIEDLEPQLSDIVEEEDDAKSVEQMEDEPIEITEFVESEVKLHDLNKEDAEVTCDDKESQTVVMEKVHDALSPEDDVKPLEETEATNDPITNETTVSQIVIEVPEVHDDKQTEFEAKEATVVPVLNFSDTCVSPEAMVVDSLDSTGHLIEDLEPQLSDIVEEEDDAKSEEQMEDKPTEDTEFVESEVKLQDLNKEDVEVTYDDKESQTVVTELSPEDDEAQRTNETEEPLEETQAINDPITDEITVSQTVIEFPEVHDDKETELEAKEAPVDPVLLFPDTCVSPEAIVADSLDSTGHLLEDLESHLSDMKLQHVDKEKIGTVNDHITNESAISQIEVADVPILIFPDTFVSPEIKIQFGSLGCQKKDHTNDPETVLDDLQENKSGEKVVKDMEDAAIPMSSVEVPSEFVDAEIEDADSDSKNNKVEDVIQHEALCLQDETINQLKSYEDEIQQQLNQKNQTQEHPKSLKKEPNPLEDNVSKPEAEVASLETRRTNEENENGKEAQTPFKAADETKSISVVSTVGKKTDSFAEKKDSDYQTMKKVAGRFNQMNKTKESVKILIKDSMFACLNEIVDDEENEFDKNSGELREEEAECKLKDQIRLREEKKADEKKDKVREKRFRKRERKRTHGDSRTNNEKIVKSTGRNIKVFIALALIITLIYLSNM